MQYTLLRMFQSRARMLFVFANHTFAGRRPVGTGDVSLERYVRPLVTCFLATVLVSFINLARVDLLLVPTFLCGAGTMDSSMKSA